MRIGELSRSTGVSIRSLRYYEEQDLLASRRSASGQRHYDAEAVERVLLIQRLFRAGLSSSTMAELLPCITDPSSRTPLLRERLLEEHARIATQLAALQITQSTLAATVAALDAE